MVDAHGSEGGRKVVYIARLGRQLPQKWHKLPILQSLTIGLGPIISDDARPFRDRKIKYLFFCQIRESQKDAESSSLSRGSDDPAMGRKEERRAATTVERGAGL